MPTTCLKMNIVRSYLMPTTCINEHCNIIPVIGHIHSPIDQNTSRQQNVPTSYQVLIAVVKTFTKRAKQYNVIINLKKSQKDLVSVRSLLSRIIILRKGRGSNLVKKVPFTSQSMSRSQCFKPIFTNATSISLNLR